jgi:hypothetical protein
MIKVCFIRINAHMDASDHSVLRPFNGPGAVASGVTQIKISVTESRGCTSKTVYFRTFMYMKVS